MGAYEDTTLLYLLDPVCFISLQRVQKMRFKKIMEDFSVDGIHQMFGGPIFEGRNKILLLGKALKLG